MVLARTAGICFCIILTSAVATGQQSKTTGQRQPGSGTSVEPSYQGSVPGRRVVTRSESGGRQVVVDTLEGLDIEGRPASIEETVTETTRTGTVTETRKDVFRFTSDRRRRLSETTESRHDAQPNGDTGTVHTTWAPDLNGGLRLTSRLIEETQSSAPDVQRTDTTLLLPHLNETLRETTLTEYRATRITPEVVRTESTHSVRDVNGRWKPIEIRRGEVRETGASERVEEETIQRPDLNGTLAVTEANVIRRFRTDDQEHVVIDTYAGDANGMRRADARPPLRGRIQRTTTATADGGRHTVEEVEARSRVAPNDPMRVIRRTVTTVRLIGPDQWVTERQVFEPDLNGGWRLVSD